MTGKLNMAFICSIVLHGIIFSSMPFFYNPVKEIPSDIMPFEFIHLQEMKESVTAEEKPLPQTIPERTAKATPSPLHVNEEKYTEKKEAIEEGIKESEQNPVAETMAEKIDGDTLPEDSQLYHMAEAWSQDIAMSQDVLPAVVASGRKASDSDENAEEFKRIIRAKIEGAKFYPRWAKERGYEGVVGVRFVVQPDGNVADIKVVRPCHCELLNKAAYEAIKKAAPFKPRPSELEGVEMTMEVDIGFRLE